MKSIAKLLDGFKISDPKVFMLVTLIANIVVGVLDYYGTYGSEDIKPLILTITSIVTLILSYLGVRTTRFIQKEQEFTDQVTEFDNEVKNTLNDSNVN
jgi:predicted permease